MHWSYTLGICLMKSNVQKVCAIAHVACWCNYQNPAQKSAQSQE